MDFINICSKIESETKSLKNQINLLESQRISSVLKSLKEDQVRLRNCIDEIQVFHRDMFVFPSTEEKSADTNNELLKNDNTKSQYYVIEPECSGNKPSNSMNKSEPSSPRLIMTFPKYLINKVYSPENDSEDEPYDIKYESDDVKDASYDMKIESEDVKNALDSSKTESDHNNDELSDEENKLAKKILLDRLDDSEEEITSLLLHLIVKFSIFQRNLRIAEGNISQLGEIYPGESNVTVTSMLKSLSKLVLYLDKTVSKIYTKYFEMLEKCLKE